jgi:hypothetical protein
MMFGLSAPAAEKMLQTVAIAKKKSFIERVEVGELL